MTLISLSIVMLRLVSSEVGDPRLDSQSSTMEIWWTGDLKTARRNALLDGV